MERKGDMVIVRTRSDDYYCAVARHSRDTSDLDTIFPRYLPGWTSADSAAFRQTMEEQGPERVLEDLLTIYEEDCLILLAHGDKMPPVRGAALRRDGRVSVMPFWASEAAPGTDRGGDCRGPQRLEQPCSHVRIVGEGGDHMVLYGLPAERLAEEYGPVYLYYDGPELLLAPDRSEVVPGDCTLMSHCDDEREEGSHGGSQ